ncbi:HNH endonuclease [uncultured Arcobacter sp.]|uniref:HNH endonuclease n=1 Tax=uncultured Arcobacter sp. TaxID=165434 RepID=UPI00260E6362|nr:HNH endonuclease [uncultured Arcobacter sp.]
MLEKIVKEKILLLYPEYDKVYGVHTRKDGRQTILLNKSYMSKHDKGRNKTISYPKAIMEVHLNKKLDKNETVDHIDKNPLNNDISNLQVLTLSEHGKLDCKRRKPIFLLCDYCGKEFQATVNQIINRNTGRKLASCCSRSCSGKYGKEIQMGVRQPIKRVKGLEKEYYCNKELNEGKI